MKPFESETLSQRVRDRLRRDILSNRLRPGTHLQEEVIAGQLAISRAPVREALRLLAAEDLVTIAPRRGVIVREISLEEFLAAYQVREALEVLALRLAIPRLTGADRRVLRSLHKKMAQAAARGDVEACGEANAAFHIFLVERSGNSLLSEIYRQLKNQMRRYRRWSTSLRGALAGPVAEHAAILDAVDRGDVDGAASLLSQHLRVPQRVLDASPEAGRRLGAGARRVIRDAGGGPDGGSPAGGGPAGRAVSGGGER